jgi:hypothetical protein
MPEIAGLYMAPLGGIPLGAMGFYQLDSGQLVYYNDGGEWFLEAGTGRPAFYVKDGAIHAA